MHSVELVVIFDVKHISISTI